MFGRCRRALAVPRRWRAVTASAASCSDRGSDGCVWAQRVIHTETSYLTVTGCWK